MVPLQTHNAIVIYFDIPGFAHHLMVCGPTQVFSQLSSVWSELRSAFQGDPNRHIYLFSDCGFLVCPFTGGNHQQHETSEKAFRGALDGAITTLQAYLNRGFFLRGALAVGDVVYDEHLFIGPPVVQAARDEAIHTPGPFILVPARERQKLLPDAPLISAVPEYTIPLKAHRGVMLGSVIVPHDYLTYIKRIREHACYFVTNGPYELAAFYSDALTVLRVHRPSWFVPSSD